ncbi:MAG TPA: VWA domain-containing protein [Polyangiaceae bacterium]
MELKAPSGLWLLGLLAPLLVLYILKTRRDRLTVSSTWLWVAAARDLLAKHPFRRLVPQATLLAELCALVLLALALSRPATRGGRIAGNHIAIVVDNSASMNALLPDGKSRLEHARAAAREVLQTLAPESEAVVIEAGRDARAISAMDRDRRRLAAAIDQIEASDSEGRLSRAVAVATSALRPFSGSVRIVVISDGALAEPDSLANASLPTDLIRIGDPVENAAVVRLDVANRTNPETHRDEVQAFALVQNFGSKPRTVYATLSQRNVEQPLASRRIDLAPGERVPAVLSFEPAPGDSGSGLIVEIAPHDALPSDDRAYGRVPNSARLPVVMAPSKASGWVSRALQADPEVELLGVSLEGLASAGVPEDALVVIQGACPSEVPGGDLLVLNPPPGACGTAIVGELLDAPSITSWTEVDPRLRFLSLDGVDLLKARKVEAESPQQALVQSAHGTLIADISTLGRTGTVVGFDVGDSNWPLKASFVLFMRNVIELARSHRSRGAEVAARAGDPYTLRVPLDVSEVTLEDPAGNKRPFSARGGLCVIPNLPRAGFYFANYKGQKTGSALIVANLTSERESDLSPHALPPGPKLTVREQPKIADAVSDWSWLLAALALAAVAADAYFLTRKARPRVLSQSPRRPDRRALPDSPARESP